MIPFAIMPLGTDSCKGPKGRDGAQELYPNKKSVLFGEAGKNGVYGLCRLLKATVQSLHPTPGRPLKAVMLHQQEPFLYLASSEENYGL